MNIEKIAELIEEKLDDKTIKVELASVDKGNGVKMNGISFTRFGDEDDFGYGCTAYIKDSDSDKTDEQIAEEIFEQYEREMKKAKKSGEEALELLKDKEKLLSVVFPHLLNAEKNIERLKENDAVYEEFLDLLVTYRVDVESGSFMMKNKILEDAGVTLDELREHAIKNISAEALCTGIGAAIGQPEVDYDIPIMVLSDKNRCFGSGLMICEEYLKQLGDDYWVIPSSVCELLKVKISDEDEQPETLKRMLHEVNTGCVPEKEFLSDNLYRCKNGKLEVA